MNEDKEFDFDELIEELKKKLNYDIFKKIEYNLITSEYFLTKGNGKTKLDKLLDVGKNCFYITVSI